MTHFEEYGYQVVEHAINEQTAELVARSIQMARDCHYFNSRLDPREIGHQNDTLVDKCFFVYSLYSCESLLEMMLPTVESVTGKYLYPSYSYARIYYEGAEMRSHIDRPSCEYSATMTLSVDESGPWEIWMEDLKGGKTALKLNIGSMCVYQGTKLHHWREPYRGKNQIQVFLHYVDQRGQYYKQMYDGRAMLGAPKTDMPYREDLSCKDT